MHLYKGSTQQFIGDAVQNRLATNLSDRFFAEFRYRPAPSEVMSWRTSLAAMASVLQLADLTDQLVILPKLFRRLAEYFALSAGSVSLDGFAAFLSSHDDRLYVISDVHATGFDNVITVDGQTVRLGKDITDLIFTEG